MITECEIPLAAFRYGNLGYIVVVVHLHQPTVGNNVLVGFLVLLFEDVHSVFINTYGFCQKI